MSTKILDVYNAARQDTTNTVVTLVTHKGRFHSDDVMATAILRYFFDDAGIVTKTVRTFTPAEDGYTDDTPNCIVYDIGLGQYDHHQAGTDAKHTYRFDKINDENGIEQTLVRKYAAVGLIWKEIGAFWVGEKYADKIYEQVVKYIDDADNGFVFNPFSNMIRYQNTDKPNATDEVHNMHFEDAVNIASKLIGHTIRHFQYVSRCESALQKLAKDGAACLIADDFLPGADDVCREHNIPFYVYPNERGGWCFKSINRNEDNNREHLLDIPDEVRKWEGVTFLHPSCFLGSAVTKERAIEICEIIKSNNSK